MLYAKAHADAEELGGLLGEDQTEARETDSGSRVTRPLDNQRRAETTSQSGENMTTSLHPEMAETARSHTSSARWRAVTPRGPARAEEVTQSRTAARFRLARVPGSEGVGLDGAPAPPRL